MKSLDGTSQDSFISEQIVPILSDVVRDESMSKKGGKIDRALTLAFFGFIASFLIVRFILPDNLIGNVLVFISFPVLFLASLTLMVFIYRQVFAEIFAARYERFLVYVRAMHTIADRFGLDYTPRPGGPAPALKILTGWRYCPQIVKDFVEKMDAHGGFDDASEIFRASGLTIPNDLVIASKKAKEKYFAQSADSQQFENGFRGLRHNMPFAALEWPERGDDNIIHHFMIALTLPMSLTGRVEFKTKKANWPAKNPHLDLKDVKLVSSDFRRNFEVRATDQMEARLIFNPAVIARLTDYSEAKMAAQNSDEKIKIRGSVFGKNLVVDFIGDKRFDLLDLDSGEWDVARIQRAVDDIKDMLILVDGVAGVFCGPQKPTKSFAPHEEAA